MAKVTSTSSAVSAWRSVRRCFWQSPEERLTQRPTWWVVAINWALAGILFVTSAMKLVRGHDPRFLLGVIPYYLLTVLELLVALMVLRGRVVLPGLFCIGLGLFGGGVALLAPGSLCGCLGSRSLHGSGIQLVLSSSVGLLGILLLQYARRQGVGVTGMMSGE